MNTGMREWTLRDTLGIIIVLGVLFGAAGTVAGLAQLLLIFVGSVIILLWIGMFILRGYLDTQRSTPIK